MKHVAALVLAVVSIALPFPVSTASPGPTIDQFLSPAYPQDLVAARKADRIAWWSYERGQRNVCTAAAQEFRPVRLTSFTEDKGVEIGDVEISDDGSVVTFVRGTAPNRDGWIANPTADSRGADRTGGGGRAHRGAAWKTGELWTRALSHEGRWIVFARDGQIYRYGVAPPAGGAGRAKADLY